MAQVVLKHAASMDSLLSDTDLDIATLLSVGQEEDDISSNHHYHGVQHVQLVGARFEGPEVTPYPSRDKTESPLVFSNVFNPYVNHRKEEFVQEDFGNVVELRGSDVGAADVKYRVKDLRTHEMPVIGVYIDERICPGFKYRIRQLCRLNRYQFNGSALYLERIGQGYGRRLTFQSPHLNINQNIFYTDTHDGGYGFSIVAVEAGASFTIWDADERAIGQALLLEVNQRQAEINSHIEKKTVCKRVVVAMKVLVNFTSRRHGMMSLINEETVNVCGVAELEKAPRSSKAELKSINNVELPIYGECHFYPNAED
ncbi:uncharacterized protein [Amphiura filiformis]|uniref:uncharacterized protein n=1 Tax=Amphiura filiformis TaxID=82378 RepID=UPI003B219F9F